MIRRVTAIQISNKREYRLNVDFGCPNCGEDVSVSWQGQPVGQRAVYPEFSDVAVCEFCNKEICVEIPRESFFRWLYYAKTEIALVYRDEQRKAVGKGRTQKIKEKKVPLKSEEVRQAVYGAILKSSEKKELRKKAS